MGGEQDHHQRDLAPLGAGRQLHGIDQLCAQDVAPGHPDLHVQTVQVMIMLITIMIVMTMIMYRKRQIVTDVAGLIIFKNRQVLYTVSTEVSNARDFNVHLTNCFAFTFNSP